MLAALCCRSKAALHPPDVFSVETGRYRTSTERATRVLGRIPPRDRAFPEVIALSTLPNLLRLSMVDKRAIGGKNPAAAGTIGCAGAGCPTFSVPAPAKCWASFLSPAWALAGKVPGSRRLAGRPLTHLDHLVSQDPAEATRGPARAQQGGGGPPDPAPGGRGGRRGTDSTRVPHRRSLRRSGSDRGTVRIAEWGAATGGPRTMTLQIESSTLELQGCSPAMHSSP